MYFSKLILMRKRLFTYVTNFFQNENGNEIKFNNRYVSNKNLYNNGRCSDLNCVKQNLKNPKQNVLF